MLDETDRKLIFKDVWNGEDAMYMRQSRVLTYADSADAFAFRVQMASASCEKGELPGVTMIVLKSCRSQASQSALLLKVSLNQEVFEPMLDPVVLNNMRRLLPGRSWDVYNFNLPFSLANAKFRSDEPRSYSDLEMEIDMDYYTPSEVIALAKVSSHSLMDRYRASKGPAKSASRACERCTGAVLSVPQLVAVAKAAGMDVVDDSIIAMKSMAADGYAIEDRKGFVCAACGRIYCLRCIVQEAPPHRNGGKACFACGNSYRRLA